MNQPDFVKANDIMDCGPNSVVEYHILQTSDEDFYIRINLDGKHYGDYGPFDTYDMCQHVYDELLNLMRQGGAIDIVKQ